MVIRRDAKELLHFRTCLVILGCIVRDYAIS
jgi:hypothetical protein